MTTIFCDLPIANSCVSTKFRDFKTVYIFDRMWRCRFISVSLINEPVLELFLRKISCKLTCYTTNVMKITWILILCSPLQVLAKHPIIQHFPFGTLMSMDPAVWRKLISIKSYISVYLIDCLYLMMETIICNIYICEELLYPDVTGPSRVT